MNATARPVESPALYSLDLVTSAADWDEVRALRYRAYRQREAIAPNVEERFADPHDAALNAMSFALRRDGILVAATRTTVSSANRRWPLPGFEAYEREILARTGVDSTLVEASRTVIDPRITAEPKALLFRLFKAHVLHCLLEDADWLLAAVRESEIGFHRRMFNMEILSGAETYPGLQTPKVLMGLDVRAHLPVLSRRIPLIVVSAAEQVAFVAGGRLGFRRPAAVEVRA